MPDRQVRLPRRLAGLLTPLWVFLFPTDCLVCRRPLGRFQHLGACLSCWTGLSILRSPLCDGCGLPRPAGSDLIGPARSRCAACRLSPLPLDAVRAAVAYDEAARRLLLRAKLGLRRELFAAFARQMIAVARASRIAQGCDAVVPVPSHPWMSLRRGFAPARELARPISRALGLPLVGSALVRRVHGRIATKRLAASHRRREAGDAFRAGGRLRSRSVLLVDDVMTTGSTLEAAARLLRRMGVAEVRALLWARTLPDAPPGRLRTKPRNN